jgi:ferritin heavy chain
MATPEETPQPTGYDYIKLSETVRQDNYKPDSEKGVNDQINMELSAMYTYLSMSYYFDRADVALPNLAAYFKKCANEEFEHAQKFMEFQNKRGGEIDLYPICAPKWQKWGKAIDAVRAALKLEKDVNQKLLNLHKTADDNNDYEMADFVDEFLHEQVDAIKELSCHLTNLLRVGAENYDDKLKSDAGKSSKFNGHGEYHFERESLSS